ncbi:MAG: hypothetical protein ABIJ94_01555 [candidate division WOR-3 bacterium]
MSTKRLKSIFERVLSVSLSFTTIIWLSGVIALAPVQGVEAAAISDVSALKDGDLIRATGDINVWFFKKNPNGTMFKRLILSPQVFNSYKHFSWDSIKEVTPALRDSLTTSVFVQVTGKPAIYVLQPNLVGDDGVVRLITNADAFVNAGTKYSAWDYVYQINDADFKAYQVGADLTTAAEVKAFASLTPGVIEGEVTPPPTAEGITVSLAATNPASSVLVVNQGVAKLAEFKFAGKGTVTGLTLKRIGVSADSTLSNVFLFDNVGRLTDAASVAQSTINFSNSAGLFSVDGEKIVAVYADLAGTSGETVGVQLTNVTVSSGEVTGLPLSGNLHSLATATLAGVTVGAPTATGNTDPGTGIVVWESNFTISTRDVTFNRIALRQLGSINAADIKNFKLLIDGTEVASVEKLDANGYVTFSATKTLSTGSRNIKVLADVIGGSSRTVQMSLRGSYDLSVTDSQYGVGVKATGTFPATPAAFTVNAGNVVVAKASDSPSGNIVENASDALLAKYTLTAYGEKVKIETLTVGVDTSGNDNQITMRNVRIMINGSQYGSTNNVAASNGFASGQSFTTNFMAEPGTPATVEIRGDIYDVNTTGGNELTNGVTFTVALLAGSSNAIPQVSLTPINVPSSNISGNTLTIATGSLALTKDQSYGNQTVVVPKQNVLLAKYNLSAGNNDDVRINTFRVDFSFGAPFAAGHLNNVYLKYGTKTTSIKATVTGSNNTFSVSETLAKNANMAVEVYGDIASGAIGGNVIPALLVSGTTISSNTAVNTNNNTVLNGQTISAVASGNLTVSLDSTTPVSAQVVAGTEQSEGALKVRLAAANEDLYVKSVTVYVDDDGDDAAIASMDMYAAQGSGSFVKVGTTQTWNANGSAPGFVTFNLSGADRVKVSKDGVSYLLFKPTYVSSSQGSVSGLTPKFFIGDLQAEGTNVLAASGTGGNLINSSGIIVQANSSSTYFNSTETTNAAVATTDTTIVTNNSVTFLAGDVIFVDENNDNTWDPATEELMVVLADVGANLTVKRAAFGTTANAYTSGKNIYRLSDATMTLNAGIVGNSMIVLKTKLTLALASDSPSGSTTGEANKLVFKFVATAANNSADPAENKVTLARVDITGTKSNATISNLALYPLEQDNNATYKTFCSALSQTKWRCTLNTASGTNEIVENTSRTYLARADVGFTGAGSVAFSIAALGTSDSATNDVNWSDGTTSITWVNQATTQILGGTMTTTASSGSPDTTGPTITSVVIGGTADDKWTNNDTVEITFSEMMDPTLFVTTGGTGTLLPTGTVTVTNIPASTGYLNRTAANPSVSVIPGIFNNLVIGGDTTGGNGPQTAAVVNLALNTAGTKLTITITTAGTLTGSAVAESFASSNPLNTTLKDINGNALQATPVTPSGNL